VWKVAIGLVVGSLATAAGLGAFSSETAPRQARDRSVEPERPPPRRAPPGSTTDSAPAKNEIPAENATALPPGRIILRIGDGYVFGETSIRADGDDDTCDIVCQDIRHGASLLCPHGAAAAAMPVAAVGLPAEVKLLAERVADAPAAMPARDVWLRPRPDAEQSGVGLVRAASGKSYRLYLVASEPAAHALQRRVTIAYAEVPAKRGGGVIGGSTSTPATALTNQDLKRYIAIGRSVPGMNGMKYLDGKYVRIEDPEPSMVLRRRSHVLEVDPFERELTLKGRGALVAGAGVGHDGHVVLDSYSAVLSRGPMSGVVDIKSYGYLHIEGDLAGTLNVDSYASVVIDGDITGTMKVRSYTELLLRGRVTGTLDAKGSCWSTFFFESYHSRLDLERLGGHFKSVTLHVKESDLAPGKHKGIGSWRYVIVGDSAWKKIRKRE